MWKTRTPLIALLTLLVLGASLLAACGDDDTATTEPTPAPTAEEPTPTSVADPTPTATAAPSEPTPTATAAPSEPTATPASEVTPTPAATPTPDPAPELTVNVYWAWTIDSTPGGSPERIGAGGRVVATREPAAAAMQALLEGPGPLESEIGMSSAIPPGTELLGITIRDGIALVDLSGEFEAGSGTLVETIRVAQVVYTLTQFDTVDAVRFAVDGEPREYLASHGIDVSSPVDRSSFISVRPLILVERPYPGADFVSGETVTGESNTFEGTVEYVVTDPDGVIIGQGFTTATAGNGTWGTFEFDVILDTEVAGRGALIVFETSARDGSQINVVEYPIELVGA